MAVPERVPEPEEPDPKGPCATRAHKVARFQALTPQEYAKLQRWAEFTAMKFRGKVHDSDAKDLLHHAILVALGEPRKWYVEKDDFLTFVGGCIRSVANGWYKRAKDTEPADVLASPVDQQAQTEASLTVDRVRECLHGHAYAIEIFDLMRQGYKGPEIRERLGITEQTYGAAYKWIIRTLQREGYRR